MVRKKSTQSKHAATVREIAKDLTKKGYEVKADVSEYRKPDTIGGYRPDVVATKGLARKIVEVETPDSVNTARDQSQQAVFKAAAAKSKNTTFQRKVTT